MNRQRVVLSPPPVHCPRCHAGLVDRDPVGMRLRCWRCAHDWREEPPTIDENQNPEGPQG